MTIVALTYRYTAFGLRFRSDIPPAEAQHLDDDLNTSLDVDVTYGPLEALWSELAGEDEAYVIQENFVLFLIENVAYYLVRDGNEIIVSPIGEPPIEKLRLFLDGYAASALLLQRRILPLHGSAIAIQGQAYAIVGQSGAGKSTLTRAFLERGYSFLTDDVIPVSIPGDGAAPMVMAALPEQKLWQECLPHFDLNGSSLPTIYEREVQRGDSVARRMKYAVAVERLQREALPLGGVFELVKEPGGEERVSLHPIQKAEKFQALLQHTFHRAIIPPLGLLEWHFGAVATLVRKIPAYRLKRAPTHFTAHELVDLIVGYIEEEQGYDRGINNGQSR
ncbi:aldolase [Paenibacillus sp. 1011MAR3C5]|uniref:aldolase n=1 Tax=Paenibacillus sp. 1011MAR3C5 TaxID=1675787 RepID=UPI000E6C1BEB|nr:aldolase [Paenibacillus sp. 1011MAR3C5]RJE86193.1 aldolase [Paenibacillus sp. 1011MAR3C5]